MVAESCGVCRLGQPGSVPSWDRGRDCYELSPTGGKTNGNVVINKNTLYQNTKYIRGLSPNAPKAIH